MNFEYAIFTGTVTFGVVLVLILMLRIHGTGIGLRISLTMMIPCAMIALTCFFLGKQGITVLNLSLVAALDIAAVFGALAVLTSQIIVRRNVSPGERSELIRTIIAKYVQGLEASCQPI